jgi:predicted acyltransferase
MLERAEASVATTDPDRPTSSARPPGRIVAIDVLRGFDMACLLIADRLIHELARLMPEQPILRGLKAQFTHPDWVGFTFYDLIFPLFEFLIGVSTWFSVSKRMERGDARSVILRHAFLRAVGLTLLGMAVNGNLLTWDPAKMRLTYSVLQMLAVASLAATVARLFLGPRAMAGVLAALLIGYWALQTFVPLPTEPRSYPGWTGAEVQAPAHQRWVYAEGAHLSYRIDEWVFGVWDRWKVGWILESMTHAATAIIGLLAGGFLARRQSPWRTSIMLVFAGALAIGLGLKWALSFPIIKNLWTSSFVLLTGGISLTLLGIVHAITDGLGWRRWAWPLEVIGANSILAYLLGNVARPVPAAFSDVLIGGLSGPAGPWYGAIHTALTALVSWLILLHLHRTKTFLRL